MRVVPVLIAFSLAAALSAPAMAATSPKVSRIASNADCNAQRKVCYASKTETGSNGVRYVPPDAVRDCEAAYRMCIRGH